MLWYHKTVQSKFEVGVHRKAYIAGLKTNFNILIWEIVWPLAAIFGATARTVRAVAPLEMLKSKVKNCSVILEYRPFFGP